MDNKGKNVPGEGRTYRPQTGNGAGRSIENTRTASGTFTDGNRHEGTFVPSPPPERSGDGRYEAERSGNNDGSLQPQNGGQSGRGIIDESSKEHRIIGDTPGQQRIIGDSKGTGNTSQGSGESAGNGDTRSGVTSGNATPDARIQHGIREKGVLQNRRDGSSVTGSKGASGTFQKTDSVLQKSKKDTFGKVDTKRINDAVASIDKQISALKYMQSKGVITKNQASRQIQRLKQQKQKILIYKGTIIAADVDYNGKLGVAGGTGKKAGKKLIGKSVSENQKNVISVGETSTMDSILDDVEAQSIKVLSTAKKVRKTVRKQGSTPDAKKAKNIRKALRKKKVKANQEAKKKAAKTTVRVVNAQKKVMQKIAQETVKILGTAAKALLTVGGPVLLLVVIVVMLMIPLLAIMGSSGSYKADATTNTQLSANESVKMAEAILTDGLYETEEWSPAQIAGWIAYCYQESGLDPTMIEGCAGEDRYSISTPKRKEIIAADYYLAAHGNGKCGIGLGQWSDGRNTALREYAAKNRVEWYTISTQMNFMLSDETELGMINRYLEETEDSMDPTECTEYMTAIFGMGGMSVEDLRNLDEKYLNDHTQYATTAYNDVMAILGLASNQGPSTVNTVTQTPQTTDTGTADTTDTTTSETDE